MMIYSTCLIAVVMVNWRTIFLVNSLLMPHMEIRLDFYFNFILFLKDNNFNAIHFIIIVPYNKLYAELNSMLVAYSLKSNSSK